MRTRPLSRAPITFLLVAVAAFGACGTYIDTDATSSADAGTVVDSAASDVTTMDAMTRDAPQVDGDAGSTAPRVVQSKYAPSGVSPVLYVDLDAPTAPGNLIIVVLSNRQTNGDLIAQVQDDQLNAYGPAVSPVPAGGGGSGCGCWTALFSVANAGGGVRRITVGFNDGSAEVWVLEVAGLALNVRVTAASGNGLGPAVVPFPVGVETSGLVVTGACTCAGLGAISADAGFTELERLDKSAAAYRFATEAGAYTASWAGVGDGVYSAGTAAFFVPAAADAGP